MTPDVRLLAIAGPPVVPEDRILDACREAVAGGVTAVQLRVKGAPAGVLCRLAADLVRTLPVPMYVNDRVDVALAAGAAGVHLGAEDLPPSSARALGPRPFRIGVSVGDAQEAAAARESDADYWSVGSVYATATKPDAGPPIGVEGFRRLRRLAPPRMPVIAIGGIAEHNAREILAAGAAGLAVSSAIFGSGDIRAAAARLRHIVERAEPSRAGAERTRRSP